MAGPVAFRCHAVLLINIFVVAKRAVAGPTFTTAWDVVVAIALLLGMLLARSMSLTAQNRVIRVEEKARLARLLPPDMNGGENGLLLGQYVGLRFAPDDEIPDLVRRIHAGELKSSGDIKRAIKNWRADTLRV
ncbi:MAG: hypothetical protein H0W63_01625 [Gemmatimonadaceae bacterium]|nr:hypothetical protein [Gemmatimonadaceae bacterium]